MFRTFLLLAACISAALPDAARGALSVKVEDKFAIPGVDTGPFFVDLVFEATGTAQSVDEALAFYDLGLTMTRVGGGTMGLEFVPPYATKLPFAENFVFPDSAEFTVAHADADSVLVNVGANSASNFDITTGKKVARVFFNMNALVEPNSRYLIGLDPELTIFAAGAGDDPIIPVTFIPGVIWVPEPGALSLVGVAALLILRRRRRA